MKRMHIDTCVYAMPEWVDVRKLSTRKEFQIYRDIFLRDFGDTLRRRIAVQLHKKEVCKNSYLFWYKGKCIGIYTLLDDESKRVTENTNFKVLCNFAISPDMQGLGFGSSLLYSAITNTAKLGCGELVLQVLETNTKAIALYERTGFVACE